ncbi:MAG: phosphoribosylformylglycinamidine synthase subunit PurS, partial [Chitinivibrionales bacterium]|nr:phosphoribosylformylglycinamidine synthase subunit PurS [Chitinivibrionales bacterium]
MSERIYVGIKAAQRDAQGEKVRNRIITNLGFGTISSIRTVALYAVSQTLSNQNLAALASGPLCDPIVQDYTLNQSFYNAFDWMVEVMFKPGVTDNIGRTAREAAAIVLQTGLNEGFSVSTGTQYFFWGALARKQVDRIAAEILANELIQSARVYSCEEWLAVHTGRFALPLVA